MEKAKHSCTGNKKWGTSFIGVILLGVGVLLIMRQTGLPIPRWIFGWEMILIIVGIFVGIQTRFRDMGWLILVMIGTVFILKDVFYYLPIREYFWPLIFVAAGLIFLLRPNLNRLKKNRETPSTPDPEISPLTNSSDVLDIAAVFGGIKQSVVSKDFRGGEIVSVFGGAEVNLSQADFTTLIELELVCVFGGVKLIIPPNWKIRSEAAAIFGGIEDKRPQSLDIAHEKILVLKGTVIFGGIDIRSF